MGETVPFLRLLCPGPEPSHREGGRRGETPPLPLATRQPEIPEDCEHLPLLVDHPGRPRRPGPGGVGVPPCRVDLRRREAGRSGTGLPETRRRSPLTGVEPGGAAGLPGGSGRGAPRRPAPEGRKVPGSPDHREGDAGAEPGAPHRRHHAAPEQADNSIGPGRPHRRRGPAVQAAGTLLPGAAGRAPLFVYCRADTVSWISRSSPPASTPTVPC